MLTALRRKFWSRQGKAKNNNSLGILDSKSPTDEYEFFIGDKKVNTSFKKLGTFENLLFI